MGHFNKIIVAYQVAEWHFDGIVIINHKYLSAIRYGEIGLMQEKVLKSIEKNKPEVIPKWLHLQSWVTALELLQHNKKLCCLQSRKKSWDFQLGFVMDVGKKYFYFHRLDLMYRLVGASPCKFPIKNIGYISFDNEYCSVVESFLAIRDRASFDQ